MAQVDHTGEKLPAEESALPLSRFEGHCLCRRMCECEELLQLAVLGVEQVKARPSMDPVLNKISDHLSQAERHVEIARRLASRWNS